MMFVMPGMTSEQGLFDFICLFPHLGCKVKLEPTCDSLRCELGRRATRHKGEQNGNRLHDINRNRLDLSPCIRIDTGFCFIQVPRRNQKIESTRYSHSHSSQRITAADPPRPPVPAFIYKPPNSALDSLCINLRGSMRSRGRREHAK